MNEALSTIHRACKMAGHGFYLGSGTLGPVWAAKEQAVLVLGPPRSGKTTSIVIPSMIAASGAVVSTSTKPDVLHATIRSRAQNGPCFVYDPSGTIGLPRDAEPARWSPITRCRDWDQALVVASQLVRSVRPAGIANRQDGFDHWTERAQALVAPLLHAAALGDAQMADLLRWVDRREASHALSLLEQEGREGPVDQLIGIASTEPREQSSIWSTASGVLSAYRSETAIATTVAPNFDARTFSESGGTLYVCATGSRQALAAPLVVGLLSEIRDATYISHAEQASDVGARAYRSSRPPLVMALDEVANIAPLPDLPTMVSEGGGQGVTTLACLQDLSQARHRWGGMADGFLSLFGTTVVLPGIADVRTLEALCTLAGDREVATRSVSTPAPDRRGGVARAIAARLVRGRASMGPDRVPTVTTSVTQRRRLPPDVVARGRPGNALMIDERNRMSWIGLTPCYDTRPWCSVVEVPHPKLESGFEAVHDERSGRDSQRAPEQVPGRVLGRG